MSVLFPENYNHNSPTLIGIEIEFQIIDKNTLDLADKIDPLMERIGNDSGVTPEVFQSCIEVKTTPVKNISEAHHQICKKLQRIMEQMDPLGIRLCSLGVHPFSKRIPGTTNNQRYLSFAKEYPYLTKHHLTFATHIHVSMESLEQSLKVMNRIRFFLPIFIALSASCPFWQEEETGFVSFRQYLLKNGLNGGVPPYFESKEDFYNFFQAVTRTNAINGLKDIHWDIRPRPDLGTLELRIMDAVPEIEEAMALCTLAYCLIEALKKQDLIELLPDVFDSIPPRWVEDINSFEASHLGIDATYICNSDGKNVALKDLVFKLLESLWETGIELGETKGLLRMRNMLESGLPYQRMQNIYNETGSFKEIVKAAYTTLDKEMGLS